MKWEPISLFTLRQIIFELTDETFSFLLSFLKTGTDEIGVAQMFVFLFKVQQLEDFADAHGYVLEDRDSPENPSKYVLCLMLVQQGRRRYGW